jgi:hypothetical protein
MRQLQEAGPRSMLWVSKWLLCVFVGWLISQWLWSFKLLEVLDLHVLCTWGGI